VGEDTIDSFEVGNRIESDHQPLVVELEGPELERVEKGKEIVRVQDWSELGIREFRSRLERVEWMGEGAVEGWRELEAAARNAVKVKEWERKSEPGWSPWWDLECKNKKREVHRARKRYKEDRSDRLKQDYIKRREYRALCERKLVEWKGREEEEIEKIKTEAQAWKFIKKGRKRKVGVSKEIKVDEWVRHFMVTLGGVEGKIEGRGEGFRRERDEMGELPKRR